VFAAPAGVPILALAADEYTHVKLSGALGHWGQDSVIDLDGLADASDHLTRTAESAAATTRGAAARLDSHRAGSAAWWDSVADALR
jgi:hypothetical protein